MLLQRHGGPDAALLAAQRADEFKAKGDEDGYEIWKAIVEAVLELMRGAPKEDERGELRPNDLIAVVSLNFLLSNT
jgi:hypothetical protein